MGPIHFLCLKKGQYENSESPSQNESNSLMDKINIFYCDNRGVRTFFSIWKLFTIYNRWCLFKTIEKVIKDTDLNVAADNLDTDLDDSMWNNRKSLKKNVSKSKLTAIIDLHKSNKWEDSASGELIGNEKNQLFESNLNKVWFEKKFLTQPTCLVFWMIVIVQIESTPAYLLPKVSSFCYDLLKSMLHKFGDGNDENVNKLTSSNKNNSNSIESEESDSEDNDMVTEEAMEVDVPGKSIKKQNLNNISNLAKEILV